MTAANKPTITIPLIPMGRLMALFSELAIVYFPLASPPLLWKFAFLVATTSTAWDSNNSYKFRCCSPSKIHLLVDFNKDTAFDKPSKFNWAIGVWQYFYFHSEASGLTATFESIICKLNPQSYPAVPTTMNHEQCIDHWSTLMHSKFIEWRH